MLQKKSPADRTKTRDLGVLGAYIGAIFVLLLAGCYVIVRLMSERAHREKWKDYNDCGWA